MDDTYPRCAPCREAMVPLFAVPEGETPLGDPHTPLFPAGESKVFRCPKCGALASWTPAPPPLQEA